MRVPIYQDDLKRNRGFKSLAKKLQKQWCGPNSVSLSFAQEVLAKGFGYRDYHDLEQASKVCKPDELPPSETDARQAIKSAIQNALGSVFAADLTKLERLVDALPISSLVAFARMETARDILSTIMKTRPLPSLTAEHLKSVKQVIEVSGNLRDQALFACMLAGVRRSELMSATVRGGTAVYGVKRSDINDRDSLPSSCRAAVDKYLKGSSISEGDCLFPSTSDPKLPLSSFKISKICAFWAHKAGIEAGLLTPHNIRRAGQDPVSRISSLLGHTPQMSTLDYVGDY